MSQHRERECVCVLQPIAERVAQHLEIISKNFQFTTRHTRSLMGFIIYYLVLIANPMSRILVRWKSFRNILEILCHPICNWLYLDAQERESVSPRETHKRESVSLLERHTRESVCPDNLSKSLTLRESLIIRDILSNIYSVSLRTCCQRFTMGWLRSVGSIK